MVSGQCSPSWLRLVYSSCTCRSNTLFGIYLAIYSRYNLKRKGGTWFTEQMQRAARVHHIFSRDLVHVDQEMDKLCCVLM